MLPRRLLTLMTRMRNSWPRSASRFLTGRTSTSDPGQERRHADVDLEAALDAIDHAAQDRLARFEGALDVVPDLHLLGLLFREDHVAVVVLGALEEDFDPVADLHGQLCRRSP